MIDVRDRRSDLRVRLCLGRVRDRLRAGFRLALMSLLLMFAVPLFGADSRFHGRLPVLATSALAQTSPSIEADLLNRINRPNDEETPLLLQADEVTYDNQNSRVIAKGNVEIYYNQYTLLADRVVYDQSINTLSAEGNVRIKEPDGAVVNADQITLTDDFRDGFIRSLRIVTIDETRIAARTARRIDGETTIFEQGVFTPCKPCGDNPDNPPLWRIKAAKVIHRKSEGTIAYEDASMEFFGVPVAYIPFFEHPDPSVKRKSGFLFPRIAHSDDLGFMAEMPYFFNLAPNYDFTFSPRVVSKQGLLVKGEWRHRLNNGIYNVRLAGIQETDPDATEDVDNEFRGSIVTRGTFSLGNWWNWGWDITAETDDTFRRFYKLDSILATDRINKVYLIGQNNRNYFEANMYHFGGLVVYEDPNPEANSRVHPVIDYNYIFGEPVLGGELSFNSNVLSLSRDNDGTISNRLITELRWRRQVIDPVGQVFEPFFSARGDIYGITNYLDPEKTGVIVPTTPDEIEAYHDERTVTRGMATGGLTYSYPFVARQAAASHVIEPIGQILVRPSLTDQTAVPNEDARSLVFDDTLLFETDKFSGYDRIETGVRANVGARYTVQLDSGGYARVVAGQSFQLAGNNPFRPDTGLFTDNSDYVAGIYFEPIENLRFISQHRFDEQNFATRRNDFTMAADYGPFAAAANYANIKPQPDLGVLDNREEILGAASLKITDRWSIFGTARYNLEDKEFVSDAVGARYSDECFLISLSYTETFIRDRDIQPDQTLVLRVEFKHLGGYSVRSGNIDDLITGSSDDS